VSEGHAPLRGRVLAAFVALVMIWGSTWLVIKDQDGFASVGWDVVARFAVATVAMFALVLARRERVWLDRQGMGLAAAVGLFQFCGNFEFVYRAEGELTSGIVACIYAVLMVPNAVLARIALGTRVSGRFVVGSVVAMAGIATLLASEARHGGAQGSVALGVVLTVGGLLCASAANILQALPVGRRQPMATLVAWAMLFGTGCDVVVALAFDGPPPVVLAPRYWMGVGYLAVFGSVVTFPLYFGLIRSMGAGRAAYISVILPVVAMGLSTLFEGYRWTWLAGVGSAVVLAGLLVALSGKAKVKG